MTARWLNEGNWHPWCEWCDTNHPEGEHGSKDSARFHPGPLRIGRDFAGNEDGAEARVLANAVIVAGTGLLDSGFNEETR